MRRVALDRMAVPVAEEGLFLVALVRQLKARPVAELDLEITAEWPGLYLQQAVVVPVQLAQVYLQAIASPVALEEVERLDYLIALEHRQPTVVVVVEREGRIMELVGLEVVVLATEQTEQIIPEEGEEQMAEAALV